MEWLGDFFNAMMSDFHGWATQLTAWFVIKSTTAYVEFKIWSISFMWDVAHEILISYDFSGFISRILNSMPPQIQGPVRFLGIPEGITMLTQAALTKYCMKFFGV
jgi:hypothetical protein